MNTYAFHVRRRNGWGSGFGPRPTHCSQCAQPLPAPPADSCGTGYGCGKAERIASHVDAPALKKGESLERSPAVCYACCAENDKRDMIATGRAVLYLVDSQASAGRHYSVQNWPGSLSIPVNAGGARRSRNNFGAQRTDVWFTFAGATWHGVNLGDSQILRCKRVKS
jgi:hypothetical protein